MGGFDLGRARLALSRHPRLYRRLREARWAAWRLRAGSTPGLSFDSEGVLCTSPERLRPRGARRRPCGDDDEITVRIGRNGELLLETGQRRLELAKRQGAPQIAFKVSGRHRQWVRLRRQLLVYAGENGGRLYQPITHPDLCDLSSHHGERRWALIEASLPIGGGSVLDVGANLGYFCHKLETRGFACWAVEDSLQVGYFLERLRRAEGRRFRTFIGSIFDFHERKEFDLLLALNVFHHFLKTREDHDALMHLLRRLNIEHLYLETHHPDEPQMAGAYRNYPPDEYVRFVLEHAGLMAARFIGETDAGRRLYLLSRQAVPS